MNILSLLSAMLATAFLIGGLYCLTRNRKSVLNAFSFLVLFFLGWWSFFNAFFFSAADAETAWFWHKIASIGWTGFIAETTYYFIALTGIHEKIKRLWMQLLFYALPTVLLLHNLFGRTTSLAQSLTKSGFGGQWTYVNSVGNVWLWIYLVCLFVYFGFAFYLLLSWALKVRHKLKKRMAVVFVILDALTILAGFVMDVVFPLTTREMPSVANLCTAFFGAGYFFIIIRFDLFNVRNVVEDRDIIESCTDAVMVTDEDGEILDCNRACAQLFETEKNKLMGSSLPMYFPDRQYETKIVGAMQGTDLLKGAEISLDAKKGSHKQLLLSAAVIRDKQSEYLGTVFSLRDITQLSRLKDQYRIQSDEYHKLAFVDMLTGLPNRRKTFEYLNECVNEYNSGGKDFFILYMDMNNFKSVNDRYGHNTGDMFLREVSLRLTQTLSDEDSFLGRLSGDEFLFVCKSDVPFKTSAMYKDRIQGAFVEPFFFGGIRIDSGISIGYAKFSEFRNIDAMVYHADEQMYLMKQENKANNAAKPE